MERTQQGFPDLIALEKFCSPEGQKLHEMRQFYPDLKRLKTPTDICIIAGYWIRGLSFWVVAFGPRNQKHIDLWRLSIANLLVLIKNPQDHQGGPWGVTSLYYGKKLGSLLLFLLSLYSLFIMKRAIMVMGRGEGTMRMGLEMHWERMQRFNHLNLLFKL